MSEDREVKVLEQSYHRNGIGGEGFVVSLLDWELGAGDTRDGSSRFIAISFFRDDTETAEGSLSATRTAVLSIKQLEDGDIQNGWRGADYIGLAVVKAWSEYQVTRDMRRRLEGR